VKLPSRLALRIWVIVLLQFLLVAAALEIGRRVTRPSSFDDEQARYVAEDVARVYDDRAALQAQLDRVAKTFSCVIRVRDAEGTVVARARPDGPPPPRDGPPGMDGPPQMSGPPGGPGGPGPGPGPHGHGGPGGPGRPPRHGQVPIPLADGRVATLEYIVPMPGPHPGPNVIMVFGLVLGIAFVTALFTARSLTKPLAALAETARAFGRGRLEARAQMNRSDEIGEVAKAFDDMANRIARLLAAERELLANVSHELRTPLARIRVALDLASEAEPREAVDSLRDIAEDLAELERIVEDVLTAARLARTDGSKESALPVRKERIPTRTLLDKSIAKFRALHRDRALDVDCADDLPELDVDPVLVRRVVDNLLDNAHKYSNSAAEPITLTARTKSGKVAIEVRDRGIGIARDDLDRVFEPFFRADRSRTRATGGLGLGLALASRVVEAHGGTIALSSELGVGTVARVELPAA
jgi:two-component system, OmpR family, sensor kinase